MTWSRSTTVLPPGSGYRMEEPAAFSVEKEERRAGAGTTRGRGRCDLPGFPGQAEQGWRERGFHGEGAAGGTGAGAGSGHSARHHAGRVGRAERVGRETRWTDSGGGEYCATDGRDGPG